MPGEMIQFPATGRTASGHLAVPPSGSGPGVIVVQEWWGLVGHITVHAFFNDQRPQVYGEPDARLAWQRTVEFLRRVLG